MLPLLGILQDPVLLRQSLWGHARWTRGVVATKLRTLRRFR